MLSLIRVAGRSTLLGAAALGTALLHGQPAFAPSEGEYSLSRGMIGDQTRPALALDADGGYVVWQDYSVDGQGLGVAARAVNSSLSPVREQTFRLNETLAGDQENAVVQLLPDGGAVFAWQGGENGAQDIFLRVLGANGLFRTGELRVNTYTDGHQVDPRLTVLADGGLVVVWTSWGQDGSMNGVFGRRLAADGTPQGEEFRVSEATRFNQRSADLAALPGGEFIVVWISEQQRTLGSVDVYARRFDANAAPLSGDVFVNASTNICANPRIAAAAQGDFVIAWSSKSLGSPAEDWDVIVAAYQANGTPRGTPRRLNQYVLGPQFAPQLAVAGNTVLAAWTSDYQDGSREGVYGRLLGVDGTLLGDAFPINTLSANRQIEPAVAAAGEGRFLAAWSSFVGLPASFEILGQRYAAAQVVPTPGAPLLTALDSYSLMVSWPPLAGYGDAVTYRVFIDGETQPRVTGESFLVATDLVPGSTHTAKLAYALGDGQVSSTSAAGAGTTWGRDENYDGLPDDWQAQYWPGEAQPPAASADSDSDGVINRDEFLAGTNPVDAGSVLRVAIAPTDQGLLVSWTGLPGSMYQLQSSGDLGHWDNLEGPRFAAGEAVSVVIPPAGGAAYYRVIRIR